MTLSLSTLQNQNFQSRPTTVDRDRTAFSKYGHIPWQPDGKWSEQVEDKKTNPAGPGKDPEPGTHKERVLKGLRERESGVKAT